MRPIWISCTGNDGKEVMVNVALAVTIQRMGKDTVIKFDEDTKAFVKEEPREILAAAAKLM